MRNDHRQARNRTPSNARNANDGLRSTNAAGQPHRSPPATPAATHRSVFPSSNAPSVRGHATSNARIGHDQRFGRQCQIEAVTTRSGISHHVGGGTKTKGTKRYSAVGG